MTFTILTNVIDGCGCSSEVIVSIKLFFFWLISKQTRSRNSVITLMKVESIFMSNRRQIDHPELANRSILLLCVRLCSVNQSIDNIQFYSVVSLGVFVTARTKRLFGVRNPSTFFFCSIMQCSSVLRLSCKIFFAFFFIFFCDFSHRFAGCDILRCVYDESTWRVRNSKNPFTCSRSSLWSCRNSFIYFSNLFLNYFCNRQ